MGASSGGCGVPGILLPAGCVTQPQMDALWKRSRADERADGRTDRVGGVLAWRQRKSLKSLNGFLFV